MLLIHDYDYRPFKITSNHNKRNFYHLKFPRRNWGAGILDFTVYKDYIIIFSYASYTNLVYFNDVNTMILWAVVATWIAFGQIFDRLSGYLWEIIGDISFYTDA